MEKSYRRFKELRIKAKAHLTGNSSLESQLQSAVTELVFLNHDDIPAIKVIEVQSIMNDCNTKKPKAEEGKIRASIDAMTSNELHSLKRKLELL